MTLTKVKANGLLNQQWGFRVAVWRYATAEVSRCIQIIFNPGSWITWLLVTLATLLWVYFLFSNAISNETNVYFILTCLQCLLKDDKETVITQNQSAKQIAKIGKYEFSVDNPGPSEYSKRLKHYSVVPQWWTGRQQISSSFYASISFSMTEQVGICQKAPQSDL